MEVIDNNNNKHQETPNDDLIINQLLDSNNNLTVNNNKNIKKRKLKYWIAFLFFFFLNLLFLIYPLLFLIDFGLSIIEKSNVTSTGIELDIPIIIPPEAIPYFKKPIYYNHYNYFNITIPSYSSFMLFSFHASSPVDLFIFRKTNLFETFWNESMNRSNDTSLIPVLLDYPLDRGVFTIQDDAFGTRLFAVKLVNETTGKFDRNLLNITTIHVMYRKLITQDKIINFKYWYWLEYEDNLWTIKFTISIILIALLIIIDTIYLLNIKTLLRNNFKTLFSKDKQPLIINDDNEEEFPEEKLNCKGATIVFNNLSFTSFTGKNILERTSGILKCGKLTAVIGKSGGGKTTFVSCLCNRATTRGVQGGEVYINEKLINSETSKMIGFVPQDDLLPYNCTVREIITFSLKYKKKFNKTQVDYIIRRLGLEKVQDSLVSKISGGERKRTSIGIEIVANVPVLILDEPTSGLDSESALQLVSLLRDFAERSNMNVICVIHQPSAEVLFQFHDMMLFNDGKLLLHSLVKDVVETLRENIPADEIRINPADEILRTLIIPIKGNALIQQILLKKKIDDNEHYLIQEEENLENFHTAAFWTQFNICVIRNIKQMYRSYLDAIIDNFICLCLGLFIGIIFHNLDFKGPVDRSLYSQCPTILRGFAMLPLSDKIAAFSSFIELSLAMIAIFRSLRVFGNEFNNFKRESYSGLSSWMYFIAKDICSFITIFFLSLFFISGIFVAKPQANFGIYLLISIITIWSSYPIGYFISLFFDPHKAQLAASLVVLLLFSISGNQPTLLELEELPFPFSYIHIFSYLRYVKGLLYMIEINTRRNTEHVDEALRLNGYEYESLGYHIYALIFWGILFRYIAIFTLWQWQPHSLLSKLIYWLKWCFGQLYQFIVNGINEMKEDLQK
ncbi:hypothetical protein ABK040_002897 [Willaertia magna]